VEVFTSFLLIYNVHKYINNFKSANVVTSLLSADQQRLIALNLCLDEGYLSVDRGQA
jgi:hypothetical protein